MINLSCCGTMGRFGNQLFQLAFGMAYAREYGAELRLPRECPLRQIFQLDHIKPIDRLLPQTGIDQVPFGQVNIDLIGYFQHKIFLSLYSRQDCREWLRFRDEIIFQYSPPKTARFVAHLRRGDYPQYPGVFTTVSQASYEKAAYQFDLTYKYSASITEITEPTTPPATPLSFLTDFFMMQNASYLLRGNSSFSWWAHALALPEQKVYSPIVKGVFGLDTSCDFVAGNWPQIMSAVSPTHSDLYLRENNS